MIAEWLPGFCVYGSKPARCGHKSALALIPRLCYTLLRRGRCSRLFLIQNSSKITLNSDRASAIIYLYLCACLQVLSSHADMPIHEMRTAVLRFFTERGLTAMRNRATLAQHSTAQHSTAQHSTAQHSTAQANCALFASCKTHGTEYRIRDG